MEHNRQIGVGRTAEVWEHGEETIVKLYLEDFFAGGCRTGVQG